MLPRVPAQLAAGLVAAGALACPTAPTPPEGPAPAVAPPFDVEAFAGDLLAQAVDRPAYTVEIAALVGVFVRDVPELQTALGGDLEPARLRAAELAALCDGSTVDVAAAGAVLVASFPAPCTLPTGVVVEGVLTATLRPDSVDVGFHDVRADGRQWSGFVTLSSTFAPVIAVVTSDLALVPVVFGVTHGWVFADDDGAAVVDVTDARFYTTTPPNPVDVGPFVIDGSVCVFAGASVAVKGLRKRADGCAQVDELHFGVELRCVADADAEPESVLLLGAIAALHPGAVDVDVTLEAGGGVDARVVRFEVPATICP